MTRKTADKTEATKKAAPGRTTKKAVVSNGLSNSLSKRDYKGVAVGEAVPAFAVAGTGGREFTQNDLKGKVTILYFYPKDNTPGCTREGHDFKAHHGAIRKLGGQVVGVSRDSIKTHDGFKMKCGFPFELLSDDKDVLAKLFDVIQIKKLYGRVFEGVERSTFVIDPRGKLRREWRRVRVEGHAAEVVAYIRDGMKG